MPLAIPHNPIHTKSMKKTKLDMSAIMADYTAKVNAEAKQRQAIREGKVTLPPTTTWNISDRD